MASSKNIAVLGGGNGAFAMAADLCSKDYLVNLFEMPEFKDKIRTVFETGTIECTGKINGKFKLNKVTDDIGEAIRDVKYIMVVTPAFAHQNYARLLKGKVNKDQVIVTFPGAFASLIYKKEFEGYECPIFAETNDLPYNTRILGPGRVHIYDMEAVEYAFMPPNSINEILPDIDEMLGHTGLFSDVMECGLSLVNPALHTGPCVLNAGLIENWTQEFFLYEQGFTPSTVKMDMALDSERKKIAAKFGYDINPFECFPNIKGEYEWEDLYRAAHGDIGLTPIKGPNDINSRYFTEDAPCGLVPWAYLGRIAGVETPVIDSVINIYNVIHEKNWWEEGVTISDLGLDNKSIDEIKEYVGTPAK